MSAPPYVDLRSDTVTRPSPAMRAAIASAEVGDDVFGDDPTVKQLEEMVADLLGMEAALFTPTGVMANQIALRAHTRPGDEILIGANAHCWRFESGALGALAGVQTQVVGDGGMFTADDVRAAHKPEDAFVSPTRVVAVENTHNMAGGTCWDRAELADVVRATHELGMAAHLDGARLWNAAVATGVTERELAAGFDSVSVCLSKGLGAPVGSLVAGSRPFIQTCRRFRKMYGGGMRQVGLLAAGGLYALEHNRPRLHEDHAHAKLLADTLAGASTNIRIDTTRVQTNIVLFELGRGSPRTLVERAREAGVLLALMDARRVRAVTHLDVDREGVLRAAGVIAELADKQ